VILEGKTFAGRERDTLAVKHYFQALEQVEQWLEAGSPITEERVRKLHAIIYAGRRVKATPYRHGQNVIRDGAGGIVYLPLSFCL
jgi:Fic family protein